MDSLLGSMRIVNGNDFIYDSSSSNSNCEQQHKHSKTFLDVKDLCKDIYLQGESISWKIRKILH